MTSHKIMLLDRDGVINEDGPAGIHSPDMWKAIPHSLEAIASLNRAGWEVFVLTNQSGIARGYYDLADFSAVNEKMLQELAAVGGCIREIFYCPHHPDEHCTCRKPAPGMFQQLQQKYGIVSLHHAFFVGDKLSDIEAARAAGCQPVLVRTGQGENTRTQHPDLSIPCFSDLSSFAEHIINKEKA